MIFKKNTECVILSNSINGQMGKKNGNFFLQMGKLWPIGWNLHYNGRKNIITSICVNILKVKMVKTLNRGKISN